MSLEPPARQLDLPFEIHDSQPPRAPAGALRAARRLRESLESALGEPVWLTITHNRHRLISTRRRDDGVHAVRLHYLFLDADVVVQRALARYVGALDAQAADELTSFVAAHGARFAAESRRSQLVRTRGRHHDLQALFDALNTRYFHGAVSARVTWGPARKAPATVRRTIRLGHYSFGERVIRIHPILDAEFVPGFYVAWVLFHEMLHEAVGQREGARPRYHSAEFHARERDYADFERAHAWERDHIDRLL